MTTGNPFPPKSKHSYIQLLNRHLLYTYYIASLEAQRLKHLLEMREGDLGSIPGSGRSPREGNGNPLQYSCLENPMDGAAW